MNSAHAVDMTTVAQSPNPVWNARLLQERQGWRSRIPSNVADEFYRYLAHHSASDYGLEPTRADVEKMPAMRRFGADLRRELVSGGGSAWIGGLDAKRLQPGQQRFFYAVLGMSMGRIMTELGYLSLYPVSRIRTFRGPKLRDI